MTERRKNQSEEWTYFNLLFIYFITVNKYRFCISVIGYINMQIIGIGIGYKKSISVDHYKQPSLNTYGCLLNYTTGERATMQHLTRYKHTHIKHRCQCKEGMERERERAKE